MQNFATMNDADYDGRIGMDEDFMKTLRTYSDNRQKEVDAGGLARNYEENINTYDALGDAAMQLGYVTMLWASYVSFSQHHIKTKSEFNEDAELNKEYKDGKTIRAEDIKVDERKFSEYALDSNKSNGKSKIFNSYGYDETSASELSKIYQTQAQEKFNAGDYTLGASDQFGQRVIINVTIGEGSNTTTVKSVWIIESDGSMRLVTPFSGFAN